MTNDKLQSVINEIEKSGLEDEATFGIFQYGRGADESIIKANRQGLLLFANELLIVAKDYDDIIKDSSKTAIVIEFEADWIHPQSDTVIQYIEPIENQKNTVKENEERVTGDLASIGCICVIIILIAALLVGLWTIGKWIF